MNTEKDYYKILNVPEEASQSDIKKAYKKLATMWHPDKNKNKDEATKVFKDISEAYQILSDEYTRDKYDNARKYGENNFDNSEFIFKNPFDVFKNSFFTGGFSGFNESNGFSGFNGFNGFNNMMNDPFFNMDNQFKMMDEQFKTMEKEFKSSVNNSSYSNFESHTVIDNGNVTKKTIKTVNKNGKKYKTVVEEANGKKTVTKTYPDGTISQEKNGGKKYKLVK